jgi:hypothetical protein
MLMCYTYTHMSMRILHIKRAHVADMGLAHEVQRDMSLNMTLLEKIYTGCVHDVCAITESGEWLMQGRKIDPSALLNLYPITYVYIHSPSSVYGIATLFCKAHAQQYVFVYNAIDTVVHHTERLASLIKTHAMLAKVPHEVYVQTQVYNEKFTSSESIASEHIRKVFLPVQIVPSLYRTRVPHVHETVLAHNHTQLSEHIDAFRHNHHNITLREYIRGENIYIVSIPHFRNEKTYITMPISSKQIEGMTHFQEIQLGNKDKEDIITVVKNISSILFEKTCVVYKLKIHGKRGVFVEGTYPAYFFIIHNQDFLFALASSHGASVRDVFEKMIA